MSQQPPSQPQLAQNGYPQWGQQTSFPYNGATIGNSSQTQQQSQGQHPSGQTQWGKQVSQPTFYGTVPVGNPPPQQQPSPWMAPYSGPFQPPSSSPYTSPPRKQPDLRPWYKSQGRGGKIALVCGLLFAVILMGYGLTIAFESMHSSMPSATPSPTAQRAAAGATATPSLAPTSTHKLKPSKVKVSVDRADFSPASLTIGVGSTVIWKNTSQVPHTVTSDDGTLDSGDLPVGGTFRFTFTKPGKFPYRCDYHPYMTGIITVE